MLQITANVLRRNCIQYLLEGLLSKLLVHVCEDSGVDSMAVGEEADFVDLCIAWWAERKVNLALVIRHHVECSIVYVILRYKLLSYIWYLCKWIFIPSHMNRIRLMYIFKILISHRLLINFAKHVELLLRFQLICIILVTCELIQHVNLRQS